MHKVQLPLIIFLGGKQMVNIINHNIFNGIAGARPSYAPKYYILHNDAGSMSAESYISWLEDRYNNGKADLGFAHYYIDRYSIARVENTFNGTWSAAHPDANLYSLSYEVCQQFSTSDEEFIENENMVLMQMAEDMTFYEDTPNYDNIKFHNEFSSTSCPARSLELHGGDNDSLRDYIIEKIKYYQSLGSTVQEMIDNDTPQEIGWVKSINDWQYRDENGLVKNDWKQVEDKWYRFDSTGYTICNEWFKNPANDKWYWLHPDGVMATGWQLINEKWYFFNEDGEMVEGWLQYKDKVYYLQSNDGDMVSRECRQIDGEWYYFNENGERLEKANIQVDEQGKIHF